LSKTGQGLESEIIVPKPEIRLNTLYTGLVELKSRGTAVLWLYGGVAPLVP
jgi:hypothetical protein